MSTSDRCIPTDKCSVVLESAVCNYRFQPSGITTHHDRKTHHQRLRPSLIGVHFVGLQIYVLLINIGHCSQAQMQYSLDCLSINQLSFIYHAVHYRLSTTTYRLISASREDTKEEGAY